jgi:hypothetical protein
VPYNPRLNNDRFFDAVILSRIWFGFSELVVCVKLIRNTKLIYKLKVALTNAALLFWAAC